MQTPQAFRVPVPESDATTHGTTPPRRRLLGQQALHLRADRRHQGDVIIAECCQR